MLPNFWDPYTYADTVSHGVTKFSTVTQRGNRHVFTLEHAPQLKGQETIALNFLGPATYQFLLFTQIATKNPGYTLMAFNDFSMVLAVVVFCNFFSVLHYKVTAFVSCSNKLMLSY